MEKINFEAGKQITPAKINEDGTITPAVWEGKTPLTPYVLNLMQTNIENAITENKVTDSSWKDLILTENFVNYNSSTKNMYRKYGNIVEVIGMVKPKTILAKGASTVCFQLPDGYRPEHKVAIICPGSEKNNWLLTINTNGNAEVARYGTTEYIDISTSTCLAYHVSFLVKAGNEINSNLESYGDRIADLEKENNELAQQMPWNNTSGKSLHITDSAKYSKNRLSISGGLEQEKRSGKNKFNVNDKKSVNDLITVDANDWITATYNNSTGTNAKYMNYMTNKCNKIKANTNYALFLEVKNVSGTGEIYLTSEIANEKMQFNNAIAVSFSNLNSNKIYKHTITSKTDLTDTAIITMMRSFVKFNAGENGSITFRISVLEDTSVTTENFKYEKYGAMPSTEFPSMPVVCTGVQKIRQFGKNWFNKDNANTLNAYIDTTIIANANSKTLFVKCKPLTTYTISRTKIGKRFKVGECSELPKAGSSLNNSYPDDFANELKSITITTSATAKYLAVFYSNIANNGANNNGYTEEELRNSIQIEEDSVATEWEPYNGTENTLNLGTTQLCAIKDTNKNIVAKDRAVYRNGKWQWEKIIKKKVLNGTENWYVTGTDTSAVNRFGTNTVFADAQPATSVNVIQPCVCDKLKTVTAGNTYNKVEGISISILHSTAKTTAVYIYTEETKNMTITEFKTWLGANNLTVYYVLATPEYIDCTAEQSVVLDKLYNNFTLQKGTNNIIVESSNSVGVNLELEYMQDNILKNNYKANEVNTGKKWIDGKDIYRRIVEVTNLSSGNNRIAHNISNFNELIDIRGTGNWNGNWQTIPRLVTDAVNTFGLGLGDINDTKFLIQVGTSYTNFTKAYIIIEYTKTIEVVE